MAYYSGSEAVWYDSPAEWQYEPQPQRTFEVIEGAGLDARAREGVGISFVNTIKVGVLFAALLVAIAFSRIYISSCTVSVLKANSEARTAINDARSARADLEVQRSVLSASARIDRIATQNLGMVLAPAGETIDVSDLFEQPEAEAEAEAGEALVDDAEAAPSSYDESPSQGEISVDIQAAAPEVSEPVSIDAPSAL